MVIPDYEIGPRETQSFPVCKRWTTRIVVHLSKHSWHSPGALVKLIKYTVVTPYADWEDWESWQEIEITPEIEGVILAVINGERGVSAPLWDYVEDMA